MDTNVRHTHTYINVRMVLTGIYIARCQPIFFSFLHSIQRNLLPNGFCTGISAPSGFRFGADFTL